jgi:hypothetical protein
VNRKRTSRLTPWLPDVEKELSSAIIGPYLKINAFPPEYRNGKTAASIGWS